MRKAQNGRNLFIPVSRYVSGEIEQRQNTENYDSHCEMGDIMDLVFVNSCNRMLNTPPSYVMKLCFVLARGSSRTHSDGLVTCNGFCKHQNAPFSFRKTPLNNCLTELIRAWSRFISDVRLPFDAAHHAPKWATCHLFSISVYIKKNVRKSFHAWQLAGYFFLEHIPL